MHKVFISYHHQNEQIYKNNLIEYGKRFGVFIDKSVDTEGISENLRDQGIDRRLAYQHQKP